MQIKFQDLRNEIIFDRIIDREDKGATATCPPLNLLMYTLSFAHPTFAILIFSCVGSVQNQAFAISTVFERPDLCSNMLQVVLQR